MALRGSIDLSSTWERASDLMTFLSIDFKDLCMTHLLRDFGLSRDAADATPNGRIA